MRQIKLCLLFLALLLPLSAQAQTAPSDTISILDQLKQLPLKEGIMYDFTNNRVLNTLGFGVISYANFGLDLAYIGVDGFGATLDYSLSGLPVKNVPILSYVQYLNVGYSVGYRTMALGDVNDNPKSDNKFIHGPTVYVKFKF